MLCEDRREQDRTGFLVQINVQLHVQIHVQVYVQLHVQIHVQIHVIPRTEEIKVSLCINVTLCNSFICPDFVGW